MVSPLRMSVISQGPPALWTRKGDRMVTEGLGLMGWTFRLPCAGPEHRRAVRSQGLSGSESSGVPDVKNQCLKNNVKGSPHVGIRRNSHPQAQEARPYLTGQACTHTGTVRSSSKMPCPFHCWAAWSSSVQTPTI